MRKFLVLLVALLSPAAAASQQAAPFCGVVDSIGYPIPAENLVPGYDDFGQYRARFGGNHTGLDIDFDHWGDPVHAIAKGRVTLSNIDEWDTEKGVVIVEHTFPDGSIAYSLYGHMEETDTYKFPLVGECVDQNSVLGGVGWPSRGRPHLHLEVRSFNPDSGGPGYITDNPMDHGWYHPLDFIHLWQIKLLPGFVDSTTFRSVPGLPPVDLDSSRYALASDNVLQIVSESAGEVLWRLETDGIITGLAGLSGARVVAHTLNGQVFTLQDGRYAALWTVKGVDAPFLTMGESLVFAMPGGGVEAYDPTGQALWSLPAVSSSNRVTQFAASGGQIAMGVPLDAGGVLWRLIDSAGQVQFEATFAHQPVVAPAWDGSWVGMDGAQFKRFVNGQNHTYGSLGVAPGRTATATVDVLGNTYLYMGDLNHTLMAVDPAGETLWQADYPTAPDSLPPLMDTGNGCLLYTLDLDGTLNVFDTTSGALVNQVALYSGGDRTTRPRARVLEVDQDEMIHVGSGFLSLLTLDGWALNHAAASQCRLG